MIADVRMLIKASVGYEVQESELPLLTYLYDGVVQRDGDP